MNGGADGTRTRKACSAQHDIASNPHSSGVCDNGCPPLLTKLGANWVQAQPWQDQVAIPHPAESARVSRTITTNKCGLIAACAEAVF